MMKGVFFFAQLGISKNAPVGQVQYVKASLVVNRVITRYLEKIVKVR